MSNPSPEVMKLAREMREGLEGVTTFTVDPSEGEQAKPEFPDPGAETARRCIEIIEKGYARQIGVVFRSDGTPSKHDRCIHDRNGYEDCEPCAVAAIRAEFGLEEQA